MNEEQTLQLSTKQVSGERSHPAPPKKSHMDQGLDEQLFLSCMKRAKYDKIQVADPTEKSLFLQKHIIHQISPRKQAKKKNQKLLSEPFIDGGKEGLT